MNRDILKRLIDVACFLAKQELLVCGHDKKNESLNKGNYIETLNILKRWDPTLNEHYETVWYLKELLVTYELN